MKTEQQLKDRCTPDIIKHMVELAEGFEYSIISFEDRFNTHTVKMGIVITCEYLEYKNIFIPMHTFPLLIHRAVEGWNKKNAHGDNVIIISDDFITYYGNEQGGIYDFKNYQSESLTLCECAILDCLLDIFKEERK